MLEGKKDRLLARDGAARCRRRAQPLQFEKAARLRDEIDALQNLGLRGDVDKDVQPEVFPIDPKKGLVGLRKVLGLAQTPRTIEGVDIAHLGGDETVASLVSFIDGLPFKPGYRRYRIKTRGGRRRLRLDPRGGRAALPPRASRTRRSRSPTSC